MSTTCKEFNKRILVEILGKQVERHKVSYRLQDVTAKDGTKGKMASDRIYLINKDGSIRNTKQKISKKERRRLRELAKKETE